VANYLVISLIEYMASTNKYAGGREIAFAYNNLDLIYFSILCNLLNVLFNQTDEFDIEVT